MTVPPRHNEPPDWDAIARHRAGESGGEESRRVSEWLAANPADAAMLAALDDATAGYAEGSAPAAGEPDVEAALRAVRSRLRDDSPARVLEFRRPRSAAAAGRSRTRWIAGVAAAAAAIGVLAVGLSRRADTSVAAGALAPGAVITTAAGVRDSVRLPDGTRVILGPATRLAVSPDYGRRGRQVTVEGEAWFGVRHQSANPFVVRAGPATVRDLGTEFSVRTDDADGVRAVTVAVTEGTVELDPDHATAASVTLKAGQRAVARSDGTVLATPGEAEADLAWMHGRMSFREAPLAAVRTDLRRWYGIELQVADSSLLGRRITATFEGDPVDSVLRVIALALGGSVERRDSVAVLRAGAPR